MAPPTIVAMFEIRGFQCAPEEITARTGIQPSEVWGPGDVIATSGIGPKRRRSGWRFKSALQETRDLEAHVIFLLDHLPPSLDVLHDVTPDWDAELSIIVEMDDEAPAMYLSSGTLRRIVALGASIDVDLYVLTRGKSDLGS